MQIILIALPAKNKKIEDEEYHEYHRGMSTNNKTPHKEKLTPAQVAAALSVSVPTVARWRSLGCPFLETRKVRLCKQASRPRYDLAAVRAWLESRNMKGGEA